MILNELSHLWKTEGEVLVKKEEEKISTESVYVKLNPTSKNSYLDSVAANHSTTVDFVSRSRDS